MMRKTPSDAASRKVSAWFTERGWKPFPFQKEVWKAYGNGDSGLLHCTTGAGKTFAVWFAALLQAMREKDTGGGLRVLWITPLRALASDTEAALASSAEALWPAWTAPHRRHIFTSAPEDGGASAGSTRHHAGEPFASAQPACVSSPLPFAAHGGNG
jgi:superfamily II DNA or RNA helicase